MRGRADKSIVSAQIAACSLILDRSCGKAGQSLAIAVDLKKRISELSHEELLQLREKYVAAVGPAPRQIEQIADQQQTTGPFDDGELA